jgi:hypothetical protein
MPGYTSPGANWEKVSGEVSSKRVKRLRKEFVGGAVALLGNQDVHLTALLGSDSELTQPCHYAGLKLAGERQHQDQVSSGSSPTFAADVRPISEIPMLMIDAHRCHVIRLKRNFPVPSDLNNTALARSYLIERSPVLEHYRDYLVADACL